jgi:L-threonate 2-dehydrogenase
MSDHLRRIGFIGLGAMGGAMAARLLAAGFEVTGFDINEQALRRFMERGGKAAATPSAAAADATLLIVMVFDASQTDTVLFGTDGAMTTMLAGQTVWLASTVTPGYAQSLARRLKESRIELIDGPVSGGVSGAEAGALTVIAGAGDAALAAAEPAMRACASHIYRVGSAGAGSTVKLVNQLLTASHIALTAEALALATRAGVDPRQLIDIITQGSGSSRQFERRALRMIAGDHTPHATVRMFLKDLAIVLDAARQMKLPTPLTTCAHEIFTLAADAGYADDSDTTLIRVYERLGSADPACGAPK